MKFGVGCQIHAKLHHPFVLLARLSFPSSRKEQTNLRPRKTRQTRDVTYERMDYISRFQRTFLGTIPERRRMQPLLDWCVVYLTVKICEYIVILGIARVLHTRCSQTIYSQFFGLNYGKCHSNSKFRGPARFLAICSSSVFLFSGINVSIKMRQITRNNGTRPIRGMCFILQFVHFVP